MNLKKTPSILALLLVVMALCLMTSVQFDSPSSAAAALLESGPASPSAIRELGTTTIDPNETADVKGTTPEAVNAGVFVVPEGQVFILTDFIVFPESPGNGVNSISLFQDDRIREFFRVPNSGPFQLHLNTGLVFGSGYSFGIRNEAASSGPIRVKITGFLSPDI